MKPLYKYNNGNGAMICNKCRTIISTGPKTDELLCEECSKNRRYYVLMEDKPCWHWSKEDDNTFDWSIIGYNSEVVSPRTEISEEDIHKASDDYAIGFMEWSQYEMPIEYFTYHTSKELLEIFKKEKGL
jgi:hypothetical protein